MGVNEEMDRQFEINAELKRLKESESRLTREVNNLRAMLGKVDECVDLINKDLTVLTASESSKNIFGTDIEGKKCFQAFRGLSIPCPIEACMVQKTLADGKKHSADVEVVGRNNDTVYFNCVSYPAFLDHEGRPDAVVKISRDISLSYHAGMEREEGVVRLRKILGGTIQAMARTVEARDAYTAGHQKRTTQIARAIAMEMNLSEDQIDGIRMAGVVHDLGKISIPAEILAKPGKINDMEFSLIKNHPSAGFESLKGIDFEWPIAQIVLQHHERMDGSGYPNKLKGDSILMEARVIAVADVIEAMASHRPYRAAIGVNEAMLELCANKGTFYDSDVVDAAMRVYENNALPLH